MMTKRDIKESLKLIEKIQKIMSNAPSPHRGMTEEEIIEDMRKTRERLWYEKYAFHPR